MKNSYLKTILCLVFSAIFIVSIPLSGFAEDNSRQCDNTESASNQDIEKSTSQTETNSQKETTTKSYDERRQELQEKLNETNEKLLNLEKDSQKTIEYLTVLDEKIGFVNEELTVLQSEVDDFEEEIKTLEKAIKKNKKNIKKNEKDVKKTEEQLAKLDENFQATYKLYCERLRAFYVSGSFSMIEFLFSSSDISTLITRYQMIEAVTSSDSALLENISEQEKEITKEQSDYQIKKANLENTRKLLNNEIKTLKCSQSGLNNRQEEIAKRKVSLVDDMDKSNNLLAELNKKDQMYTEFKYADNYELGKIEAEITGTLEEYVATHDPSVPDSEKNNSSEIKSEKSSVLNMTYPVPGHYTVSAKFGHGGYSSGGYHGGIDFPCSTGSNVVASQSGTVIKATNQSSYGNFIMIYHGRDLKGRTVATIYAHNSKLLVSVGDTVKKGQKIAKSGSTGNSTGPHCHFEVRINGGRVNPKNYLS